MKKFIFLIAIAVFCASAAFSQTAEVEYKLLATTKTSTMQKELEEAAAEGFKIVAGSPTAGNEMVLLLARTATKEAPYKYMLLATTKTSTMQKELAEAAENGYRLLPRTMVPKQQVLGGVEIVVILEKTPNSKKKYEYKLLATSRTGTMQKEIAEAQNAGFMLAGVVSRGEHMVIMEKEY